MIPPKKYYEKNISLLNEKDYNLKETLSWACDQVLTLKLRLMSWTGPLITRFNFQIIRGITNDIFGGYFCKIKVLSQARQISDGFLILIWIRPVLMVHWIEKSKFLLWQIWVVAHLENYPTTVFSMFTFNQHCQSLPDGLHFRVL